MRGKIGLWLLVLAVAAAVGWGFVPRPVAVDMAVAARGPLAVTVEEEGKTRVVERYVVSAPMGGYARRIDLHVGDPVAAGQMLTLLEPSHAEALDPRTRAEARARKSAAEAALAAAREQARAASADAALASHELERAQALVKSNFVSKQAVDRAASEARRTQAALRAAEHAVTVARYELDAARAVVERSAALEKGRPAETWSVDSPVAGRVLKVMRESEGPVRAGEPLIEIGDPQLLEVAVEVLSTSAVKIGPGTPVRLDRWGGEGLLDAVVRVVEPAGFTKISALGVEEQRVLVIADITSPRERWARLGDAYRVEARFVVWEEPDVLQVPASALFRRGEQWGVFVVEEGRARRKPVEVGQRNGLQAQILSGLALGERVVVHPDDRVADGVRVRAREG